MFHRPRRKRRKRSSTNITKAIFLFLATVAVVCLQGFINVIWFLQGQKGQQREQDQREQDQLEAQLQVEIDHLQKDIDEYQYHQLSPQSYRYQDDGDFLAFTIRDARRLGPNPFTAPGVHIFDYKDISRGNLPQKRSQNSQLFYNARLVGDAPCQRYDVMCYKQKILQVFNYLMDSNKNATYFFYMEADNDLCVPLQYIRNLTHHYQRYFISTGIGFSGWIMRRDFVQAFLDVYTPKHRKGLEGPDVIGSMLLMEQQAWSVTRRYMVSHTILPTFGSKALTVGRESNNATKHLPRCFEPRRGLWPISDEDRRDQYGWDYFDYDLCATSELFPCAPGQLEAIMNMSTTEVHVNDSLAGFDNGRTGPHSFLRKHHLLQQRMEGQFGDTASENLVTGWRGRTRRRKQIREKVFPNEPFGHG
jgi:hypothetical protein